MSRVFFIKEASLVHTQYPIENSDLLVTSISLAKVATYLDFEGLCHLGFVPGQVLKGAKTCEVVAVHNQGQMTLIMVETAG